MKLQFLSAVFGLVCLNFSEFGAFHVQGTPVAGQSNTSESATATVQDISTMYASNSPEPMFITSSATMPTPTKLATGYANILTMPNDIPPRLEGKNLDGMTVWFDYSKGFAVIVKSVCDSKLDHSGPLVPNWPIILSAGNSMTGDNCGVANGAVFSTGDALPLFSSVKNDINRAIKIVVANQTDSPSAGQYLQRILNNNQALLDVICNTNYKYMGAASCGNTYTIVLADDTWDLSA